jgi:hypothetical protein
MKSFLDYAKEGVSMNTLVLNQPMSTDLIPVNLA